MGEVAASDLQVADAPGEDPPLKTIPDPVILRFAVLAYLVILPVGHLVAGYLSCCISWCVSILKPLRHTTPTPG